MTKVVETKMTCCLPFKLHLELVLISVHDKSCRDKNDEVSNWSFLSQQLLSCTDIKASFRGSSNGKQLVIFVSTTFVMY
jgi:hypothetical protein